MVHGEDLCALVKIWRQSQTGPQKFTTAPDAVRPPDVRPWVEAITVQCFLSFHNLLRTLNRL